MLKNWLRLGCVALLAHCCMGQAGYRYFYDDANELFRVLDTTGNLVEYVHDASGNITKVNRLTVAPGTLAVLNIVPLSGPAGQTVTIYGQNFGNSIGGNQVKFGGVNATVISASPSTLVVQIPAGFTNGQVTVTVNGTTASSGTLQFTPPPAISSITPTYGVAGQALNNVVIQGANLTGATFSLQGGGTVTMVSGADAQAVVNILPGPVPGPFVLLASSSSGATSSTVGTDANTFIIYNTAGNNYSDATFSVFNPNGPMPFYPPGTNKLDVTFSVFNPNGPTPGFPPGTNKLDVTFSVFNPNGPMPFYPPGTNKLDVTFSVFNPNGPTPFYPPGTNTLNMLFSVFNSQITPGTRPVIPAGSNEAWQLFSTKNQTGAGPVSLAISMGRSPIRGIEPGRIMPPDESGRSAIRMLAGQSLELAIRPPVLAHYLEVDANGAPLASSTSGSLRMRLTAPFGVESFNLRAFGYTASGSTTESTLQTVQVSPDGGRNVSGQVTEANGAPVVGARVTWEAPGLAAEYYRLDREWTTVPELGSLMPARVAFTGSVDYPNPRQVFGADPMGIGLGKNYAARLSGKLQADVAGNYQFGVRAHAGARLKIDGQIVAEATATGSEAALAQGGVNLTAGLHEIEVTCFEAGGASALQLMWTPPGGEQSAMPAGALWAESPAVWRAVTGNDGRFVLRVPAALDGVAVKLVSGAGSVQVDQ